ncbi:DMT family transporter [Lawsonibacter sp. OA9]|uniref:DMT family transporter n=1 Tax=Lawsonibacter sp. OA9 TaxID=2914163 RepID=UPI001F061887|nr:DMT family transporter [Lawsonibacter sp. OA9]MCH1979704.1 DMT family transporter [Lawsonibacter sp. OA9]
MKTGYLYIAIAVVMFSSFEVVLKFIAGELNPVQLTFARFVIGFLFLLPLALHTLRKRKKRLDTKTLAYFALLGFTGISLSMTILHLAVEYTSSSVTAVLFSCNPVFVTFLAFFLLHEPIKKRHVAALIFEIIGTLAIINPFHSNLNMLGVSLALLSTLLFSLYGVMGKRKCAEYGGVVVTCFSFLFGSLIVLLFIVLSHIPAVAAAITSAGLPNFANIPILAGYTMENLPYVLYVSAGVAGIGFCSYFLAMEYQPASVVSLVYFFKPALSPILAWWLHREDIPGNMLLGILLIVVGSLCSIIPGILEAKRPTVSH